MPGLDIRSLGVKHRLFLTWQYMSNRFEGMEPFHEWFLVIIEAFAAYCKTELIRYVEE